MEETHTQRLTRLQVMQHFLEQCRPPSVQELSEATEIPETEVEGILKVLEARRHIVLHRENVHSPTLIAMAHPFAHLPTLFTVTNGPKTWWANCAWCAFGLASILPHSLPSPAPTTLIRTLDAGIGPPLDISITGDEVTGPPGAVAHFSIPPSKMWDDVKVACGTILLFSDERAVKGWCGERGFFEGDVVGLATLWKLSKAWYHDKATLGYTRKSREEVEVLFEELGLTAAFWRQ